MKTIGLKFNRFLFTAGVIFITFFSTIMPVVASAAEVSANASVQTVQLLPPNVGNTCPQFATPIFKAYVYENTVNSFDVTVTDASYVAIAGSVGETQIPFNYVTRLVDASGILHMHVDTPSTSVHHSLPITLTLLSVRADKTVCAATISTYLVGTGAAILPSQPSSQASDHDQTYTPTLGGASQGEGAPSDVNDTQGPDEVVAASSGVQNTLDAVCTTTSGATRLWTVLLAIYLLIVAATILAQPTGKSTDQSTFLLGAAIAIPLVVLFGVWGYASACRIGVWPPIAALVIAAAGFALGFRHHPQLSKTFTIPPAPPKSPPSTPSTKPMITPPPKSLPSQEKKN